MPIRIRNRPDIHLAVSKCWALFSFASLVVAVVESILQGRKDQVPMWTASLIPASMGMYFVWVAGCRIGWLMLPLEILRLLLSTPWATTLFWLNYAVFGLLFFAFGTVYSVARLMGA